MTARPVWAATGLTLSLVAGWAGPAGAQGLMETAKTRLAKLDGRVQVAGLDSAVEVRRDSAGVPHIYAKTVHDLFFTQGYVAAQDRLWQMEMWRRNGEGRLAEVLGPSQVERDRFARLLKYRGDMLEEWASYAPDAQAIIRAFVGGINAYIAEVRERPPVEFTLLGFQPESWTETVPLQRMAALVMTGNASTEVRRAAAVAAIGTDLVAALWPTDPPRPLDPVPGLDLAGIGAASLGALDQASGPVAYARTQGSNNWVVSGAKTATGKPILANDPHRAIALPALRYITHLVGPGWNVLGAGEPALPGVTVGHNERVGFGFTIVGMDQQDVYVEKVGRCPQRGDGERCYWRDGAWKPMTVIVDTIPVKGQAPRIVRLEFTGHGPVVAEDPARSRVFALKFVGAEPGTAGYLAQLSVNRATDWSSFREAARRWKLPTENLIYADVDGNIGWVAAGVMPVRTWSGLLPVPGDGRFEWAGFVPFDLLPSAFNPPSGFIATANNNILPPNYTTPLNYEWMAPYRAERIAEQLAGRSGWTRRDFERLQHDEYSTPAAMLVPVLVDAAAKAGRSDDPAVKVLRRWNFTMSRDSVAPTVYAAWLKALGPRVIGARAKAAAAAMDHAWDIPTLIWLVTHPDKSFGPRPAAGRDTVVLKALDDAQADLIKRLGRNPSGWRWGALHQARFHHPVADGFGLAAVPRGGDENTINATSSDGDYHQVDGASFRQILDLDDWDNSVATSTPGQSGQPGSPHYADLLPLWAEGKYFALPYSRHAVERATAHVLWLEP